MRARLRAIGRLLADIFVGEWEAHHPGTGRHSEHVSFWHALDWYIGQSFECLVRCWLVPFLALAVVIWCGVWRGRKGVC